MERLTLGAVKNTIGKLMMVCPDDPRVAEYLNRAQQRLLPKGHWVGTTGRYRLCARAACITWPREFVTIEAYALCESPGIIRNQWYEFIGSGPGQLAGDDYVGNTLVDRGMNCAFDDVRGTFQKLWLYADQASDAGKQVLVQYFDSNGNKVLTNQSGTYAEGELITLVAPPAYAASTYFVAPGGLYAVIKPLTNGVVRCYCRDTVNNTQYPLAYWDPSETLPSYRRSMIPYLTSYAQCNGADPTCTSKQVTVIAKLRMIPVMRDNDWLLIGNQPALEDGVRAVMYSEKEGMREAAEAEEASAVRRLQEELQEYEGAGAVVTVRTESTNTWGGGGVDNWN